jgi:ABC-type nickel/cobalt efflux system permease component RcnA
MNWPTSLLAIIAAYALLGMTLLGSSLAFLAPFSTIIQIISVLTIVLFSLVIIYRALRALFSKTG